MRKGAEVVDKEMKKMIDRLKEMQDPEKIMFAGLDELGNRFIRKVKLSTPHVSGIKEVALIWSISEKYLQKLNDEIERLDNDLIVETSDEPSVERRENIYALTPSVEETLDDRKFDILAKMSDPAIYTMRYLQAYLANLIGQENFRLTADAKKMTVALSVTISGKSQEATIKKYMDKIVPLHIRLEFETLYNTWGDIKDHTSSWADLKKHTWQYWKETRLG